MEENNNSMSLLIIITVLGLLCCSAVLTYFVHDNIIKQENTLKSLKSSAENYINKNYNDINKIITTCSYLKPENQSTTAKGKCFSISDKYILETDLILFENWQVINLNKKTNLN